jgi:hypothetical protein
VRYRLFEEFTDFFQEEEKQYTAPPSNLLSLEAFPPRHVHPRISDVALAVSELNIYGHVKFVIQRAKAEAVRLQALGAGIDQALGDIYDNIKSLKEILARLEKHEAAFKKLGAEFNEAMDVKDDLEKKISRLREDPGVAATEQYGHAFNQRMKRQTPRNPTPAPSSSATLKRKRVSASIWDLNNSSDDEDIYGQQAGMTDLSIKRPKNDGTEPGPSDRNSTPTAVGHGVVANSDNGDAGGKAPSEE